MARNRFGFDASALKEYGEKLEAIGGSAAVKRAVGGGMKSTKQKVNQKITAAMQKPNLPAQGKYSHAYTLEHLDRDAYVDWEGNMARVKLGFKIVDHGIVSIFLMYGTPQHDPASGLREAIFEEPKKISKKEMQKACKKVLERMGG